MQTLWSTNISKGGLFVVTNDPPPLRTRVVVKLQTDAGTLALQTEVVHLMDAAMAAQVGSPAGVGLCFVDVGPDQRAWIQRFMDGMLAPVAAAAPGTGTTVEAAMADARAVLAGMDAGNPFTALGVPPTASEAEVRTRLETLRNRLCYPPPDATPAQAVRLEAAARALRRCEVLLDPKQRAALQSSARQATPAPQPAARSNTQPPGSATMQSAAAAAARRVAAMEANSRGERGRALLAAAKFAEAEAEFARAEELDPASASHTTERAWATFFNPQRPEQERRALALGMIKTVTEKFPTYVDGHCKLGLLKHMDGDEKGATEAMKRVLSLDTKHVEAARILRLYELRAAKASEAKTAEGQAALAFLAKMRRGS